MKQGQVLFLNEKQIQSLVTPAQAIDLVEKAFLDHGRGVTVNPVKLHLPIYPDADGYINSMPSYNRETKATGVKLVSVYHDNPREHQTPATLGTIVLHDWETGMPYAIMGGTHVTNIRTGAAAGLKAKILARKDAKVLTIIGAGAQGFSAMVNALTGMGPGQITTVNVADLHEKQRTNFIAKAKALYPDLEFVSCPDNISAMENADVALFCTTAPVPLLENCPVKEGATVICVAELLTPKAIGMFDRLYADFTECVLERFNALGREGAKKTGRPYEDLTEDLITGQFGEVLAGTLPGRVSDKDRLLTIDVGMSVEDIIVARFVYEQAVEKGVGTILDFQNLEL